MVTITHGRQRYIPRLRNLICRSDYQESHNDIYQSHIFQHHQCARNSCLPTLIGKHNTICPGGTDYCIMWWMAKSEECSWRRDSYCVFGKCTQRKGGIRSSFGDEQEGIQWGENETTTSGYRYCIKFEISKAFWRGVSVKIFRFGPRYTWWDSYHLNLLTSRLKRFLPCPFSSLHFNHLLTSFRHLRVSHHFRSLGIFYYKFRYTKKSTFGVLEGEILGCEFYFKRGVKKG